MTEDFEAVIAGLELEEKVALASGADMWHTAAVERLGIPGLWMSDGPNGVRGTQFSGSSTSACFPCGAALGATFDAELVRQVAAALGLEARRMGVHALLGPTVNIARLPVAGRNFECFSEDPYLTSRLAAAYVAGVQSQGVAAVVKHFVCNDSERERYTTSSEVDERTLREVYLAPFAAAVAEAGAWAVMSGYNRVNGVYACEHEELLRGVLKGEWRFSGPVISDWYGTTSTVAAANGGLDIEMPGPPRRFGADLLDAVRSGAVDLATLDDKVRRLLRLVARTTGAAPRDDGTAPAALIRRAAAEATVLLQNRGGVLPLDPARLHAIAVIGPNAAAIQAHGGGSARVDAPYVVGPVEAIRARCGPSVAVSHEPGCLIERGLAVLDGRHLVGADGLPAERPVTVEYFDNPDLDGDPVAVETAPAFHFAWNGPPAAGLTVGKYSVRLRGRLVPDASGPAQLGIGGIGRMRLLLDRETVIDNWEDPAVAPILFGRGAGQLSTRVELAAGRTALVEVEFQAPGPELAHRALELSLVPPTEAENSAFGSAGVTVGYRPAMPADLEARAEGLARAADVVVVVVGTNENWESEGFDRDALGLPGEQDRLIARVAKANPNVVVVVNAGAAVEMPWAPEVAAILQLWLPGQEAGNSLADVLFGDVNPSARLPVTVPVRLEDSGAAGGYPPSDERLRYAEGLNVGHRHYDAAGIAPRFCFGHGLSYTTFSYGDLLLEAGDDGALTASVTVTNTGDRPGAEVVQCYVSDLDASVPRPARELKGFVKLRLRPGERGSASFPLGPSAFAFWDREQGGWSIEAGEFEIAVGASSRDLRARVSARITAQGRPA